MFFVSFVVIELCPYHSVVPNTLKLTALNPARDLIHVGRVRCERAFALPPAGFVAVHRHPS